MRKGWESVLQWTWDIPVAIASFLVFKCVKWVIGVLYARYLGMNRTVASRWRVLSTETLASPLSLPVLMTKGPRWNTHAIIGTVGPFEVQKELALDAQAIAQSARSWTAAIYSYPTYATVGNLGSLETPLASDPLPASATDASKTDASRTDASSTVTQTETQVSLALPPGRYSIGLRYYHWSESPVMPTVTVDGAVAIAAQPVLPTVNEFYDTLSQKTNGFYRFLHSYVFTILHLRRWLPASFVRREFLPVGAPETYFFYDAIEQGDRLTASLAPSLVNDFDVYLTTYNRASFPLMSKVITTPEFVSQPMPCDGFYLFRVRPKSPQQTTFSQDWLTITCDPA